MLLWLLSVVAAAGNLYINGTFVEPRSVSGVTLEKVTVRFDDAGNIMVEAPGYKIQVVDPPSGAVTPPLPPAPTASTLAPPMPATVGTPPPSASGVTPARYWLVTEDSGSAGHTVEVWINGSRALEIRSGQPQKILEVGRWMRPGPNQVVVRSNSVNATGGSFYVFIGTGSDQSGTVVMDDPTVQFGVGATRSGPYEREYTLDAR